MMPTGCKMRDRVMMATVTGVVPPVGVLLEVVVVVVWQEEVDARWCVTTVTKPGISLETIRTQL